MSDSEAKRCVLSRSGSDGGAGLCVKDIAIGQAIDTRNGAKRNGSNGAESECERERESERVCE